MKTRARNKIAAALAAFTLAILAPAGAQITVDDTHPAGGFGSSTGSKTLTIDPLDFDPSGSDKLVVLVGGRGSGGSIWGKSWKSASWGATPMLTAVDLRSGDVSPTPDGEEVAAIAYLDNPTSETSVTVEFNGKMDSSTYVFLMALSGTAADVGATNGTITGEITTPVSSASTSLTTTAAGSLVIAVSAANRVTQTAQAPMGVVFATGGVSMGAGKQDVPGFGSTITPTFSYAAPKTTPIVIAAEFLSANTPPGPEITSITSLGSGVWELTLEGEADTAYEFRSSATLDFDPGTLVENLTDGVPAVGTIGGDNDSQLTTDSNGDGTVRMTLAGPANYVRAQIPPPPPPLLDEDFEGGDGGFTVSTPSGLTSWAHGDPNSNDDGGTPNPGGSVTEGNDSSTNCWGTDIGNPGYYADPTNTCLRSSVVDLTGTTAAELSFAQALDLDSGDSVTVNIIDDTTDTPIASNIVTITDTNLSTADWESVGPVAIPAGALGQAVRIEWCLTGTGGGDKDFMGWYIDDVMVEDTSP